MTNSYISIRVSTLRGDQKINFDTYIKINEKMILYLRRGDSFEGTRLSRLKEKKLKKMFIQPDDEGHYREYLQRNIEMAFDPNSKATLQSRAEIAQGQQECQAEDVFENPDDAEAYLQAKDATGKYVQFLVSNNEAVKSVLNMDNSDKSITHHGVSVATLSVRLAQELGYEDPKQMQILALGATLHDFGHFNSPIYPRKKVADMTPDELTLYKTHPMEGARKIQSIKHFDPKIVHIMAEHEECLDGSGYPRGLIEGQIDPLSLIVGVCNAFDRMITFEGLPRDEACKKLMTAHVGKYPLDHIQKVIEIVKSL